MIHYNKLIRDKIPENKLQEGKPIATHVASDEEYWPKLLAKLQEEIDEFGERVDVESLADVFEVLDAVCQFKNIDISDVRARKENKKLEQGSFEGRVILDSSPEEIGHRQEQQI